MALITATQATALVNTYASVLVADAEAQLVARYQTTFDQIAAKAAQGLAEVTQRWTQAQYAEIVSLLRTNGYTVSDYPPGLEAGVTATITISWTGTNLIATPITGIAPTQITGIVNTAQTVTFTPLGGAGPYTFTQSAGTLPVGFAYGPNTNVNALTLSGTPTQAGLGTFDLTLRDSFGQEQTVTIGWTIGAVTGTQLATYSQVGLVKPDFTSLTIDTSGTLAVKTATTTNLGLVKQDDTTITNTNGTLSVNTAYLKSQIRNISIATTIGLT